MKTKEEVTLELEMRLFVQKMGETPDLVGLSTQEKEQTIERHTLWAAESAVAEAAVFFRVRSLTLNAAE